MPNNTRARSEEIQQAARSLLEEYNISIFVPVPWRDLAPELMKRTGCREITARNHLVKAQRRARGEEWERRQGGARPGAGAPEGNQNAKKRTADESV